MAGKSIAADHPSAQKFHSSFKLEPPPIQVVAKKDDSKKDEPKMDAGDLARFAGTWERRFGKLKERLTVTVDGDKASVASILQEGDQVVGTWHGKDVRATAGVVSYLHVWDRKPFPNWPDNMEETLTVSGDTLTVTWRGPQGIGTSSLTRVNTKPFVE